MLKTLTRTGIAAAACAVAALLAPGAASAQAYAYQGSAQNYGTGAYGQPYDYNGRYQNGYDSRYQTGYASRYNATPGYYDACERRRDSQVAAGVVGATLGAIAGSQIAARGHRTDGSILGGVLGAVVGASAGSSAGRNSNGAAACDNRYDRSGYDYRYGDSSSSYDRSYDDRYRNDGYDRGYNDNGSSYGAYGYGSSGYGSSGYGSSDYGSSDYGSSGYGSSGYRTDRDGCRVAQSQVRLPGGRYETRYVRACPDRYGRYRVVD